MSEIIDAHTHIFPDDLVDRAMEALHEAYQAEPVRRPTVSGLLEEMAASGVSRSVVAPVSTKASQVRGINDWAISLRGPRLIPFCTLHPHCEGLEEEIERVIAAGIRGVKLQPFFQGYDFEDGRAREMFEMIAGRLVVLMHGGQEIVDIPNVIPAPEPLARLKRDFAELQIVVAHLGGYNMWDEVEEHLVGEDVYFDLSYTFNRAPDELIRRIGDRHGWERIVFASDFPWQSQREALDGLMRLGLPDDTLAGVLSGNLRGLLGLDGQSDVPEETTRIGR